MRVWFDHISRGAAGRRHRADACRPTPEHSSCRHRARFSRAETRILEQYWKLGTCAVREILDSLPVEGRVAYTTVQTLVYRLEQKGALRKVKKIGNAHLFEPAIDRNEFPRGLVRDFLDLFGDSPRVLVSSLIETGTLTLKDLKALQNAAASGRQQQAAIACRRFAAGASKHAVLCPN